jgi:hypothetical protein
MQPISTHIIGVQSKEPSHAYPFIRLPREFRKLIGAKATIYETTHNGDPAFLVVPHREHKESSAGAPTTQRSLHTAEVAGSNPAEPIGFLECFDEITGSGELFDFRL